VLDRRNGAREPSLPVPPVERRSSRRHNKEDRPPTVPSHSAALPAFRLAHQGADWELYESTSPESGRCPGCQALVGVELPLFAEPPVRLELVIQHEPGPGATRHVVDLQSFSATGRVVLATRIVGRITPASESDRI
jgi:hypothetical protein